LTKKKKIGIANLQENPTCRNQPSEPEGTRSKKREQKKAAGQKQKSCGKKGRTRGNGKAGSQEVRGKQAG